MIILSALLKKNIEKLSTLEEDNETAIDWFKINEVIVNLDKFQAIVVKKNCRMKHPDALNVNQLPINSESFLKLL